jgi:hypothetical protein
MPTIFNLTREHKASIPESLVGHDTLVEDFEL